MRKTRTNLRLVGKVGTISVYDLEYFFTDEGKWPDMRSVLVETGPDQFHEIEVDLNHVQSGMIPSVIIEADHQLILKVKWSDGGFYGIPHETYYLLAQDGETTTDFKPLYDVAERVVPNNLVMYAPTLEFDWNALVFHVKTEKRDANIDPKVACCEGCVDVRFRIEKGKIVPGAANYFPN